MGTLLATSSSTSTSSTSSTDTVVGKPIPAKRTKLSVQSKSDPQTKGELAIISNGLTARPVPAPRTKLLEAREQARQEWVQKAKQSAYDVIYAVASENFEIAKHNLEARDLTLKALRREYDQACSGYDYMWDHRNNGEITIDQLDFALTNQLQCFKELHAYEDKAILTLVGDTTAKMLSDQAKAYERIEANSYHFDDPNYVFFKEPS